MNLAKGKPADSNGDMIKYVHFVGKMMGMVEMVRNDVWQTCGERRWRGGERRWGWWR